MGRSTNMPINSPTNLNLKVFSRQVIHGARFMGNSKSPLRNLFVWSYQRGTLQYDIICILILLFVFLMPKSCLISKSTNSSGVPTLIRTSHQPSAAASYPSALTALCSAVLHEYACAGLGRNALSGPRLRRLATNAGEKCGLVAFKLALVV